MPNPAYRYDCEIIRVIDGDTVDAIVDLGFYMKSHIRFRLADLDCPETRTTNKKEKALGQLAKKFTVDFFGELPCRASLISEKGDKFGRWVATVYKGAACLNDLLLESKLAKKYSGGKRPRWP